MTCNIVESSLARSGERGVLESMSLWSRTPTWTMPPHRKFATSLPKKVITAIGAQITELKPRSTPKVSKSLPCLLSFYAF